MPILVDKLSVLYHDGRSPGKVGEVSNSTPDRSQAKKGVAAAVVTVADRKREPMSAAEGETGEEEEDDDPTQLTPEEMNRLLTEVKNKSAAIEKSVFVFAEVVKGVEALHQRQKNTASLEDRKTLGEELGEGISAGNAMMFNIQSSLKELRTVGLAQHMRAGKGDKFMASRAQPPSKEGGALLEEGVADDFNETSLLTVVDRIRDNQHLHLMNHFLQVCTTFQDVQETAELTDKAEIKRWLKMRFTPGSGDKSKMWHANQCLISDEDAERLSSQILACDDPAAAQGLIFAQQRVVEQKMEAESAAYHQELLFHQSIDMLTNQVEIRNDIHRIEKSMIQLNQLFSDMAILVNEQQPVLESILYNCERAERHLENGLRELDKAKAYQRSASAKIRAGALCCGIM